MPIREATGVFDLPQQSSFLDPLTHTPLYTVQGNLVVRMRNLDSIHPIDDKLLCKLTHISYIHHSDPKHQIHEVQKQFQKCVKPKTIEGLFEIVERMDDLTYGEGTPPQVIWDSLTKGYRLNCSDVTAIVAACLESWNVPFRIGSGYGLNLGFEFENKKYRYFLDDDPGFGSIQHCWIEIYLEDKWIVFDPTIYLNKFKTKPAPALLEKYREIALQRHSEPFLYQWALADYFNHQPYEKNFRKTLLMFSGGIDSTAVLVDLLTNTNDVVQVHHVTLGKDKRVEVENQHAQEIIRFCQTHYRPFVYTESTVDVTAPNGGRSDDIYHIMYAAAHAMRFDHRGHHFDRAVCGGLQLDEEEKFTPGAKKRERESRELFDFLIALGNDIPKPECQIVYNPGWTKKNAWDILPLPLQKKVWYCRNPLLKDKGCIPCGQCETCIHVRDTWLQN